MNFMPSDGWDCDEIKYKGDFRKAGRFSGKISLVLYMLSFYCF